MTDHCETFCFVCDAVLLSFCCISLVLSCTVITSMGKKEMVLCDGSLWDFSVSYVVLFCCPFVVFFGSGTVPVSILYKSIAGRYRPVRVADGPITARYRFIKNASWGDPGLGREQWFYVAAHFGSSSFIWGYGCCYMYVTAHCGTFLLFMWCCFVVFLLYLVGHV